MMAPPAMPPGMPSGVGAPMPPVERKTVIRRRVKLRMNGREESIDLDGGVTEALVNDVAGRMGIGADQARQLLQAAAGAASAAMPKCPACGKDVPPGRFCNCCGAPLS